MWRIICYTLREIYDDFTEITVIQTSILEIKLSLKRNEKKLSKHFHGFAIARFCYTGENKLN